MSRLSCRFSSYDIALQISSSSLSNWNTLPAATAFLAGFGVVFCFLVGAGGDVTGVVGLGGALAALEPACFENESLFGDIIGATC